MIRTQVYITEREKKMLVQLSKQNKKSQSELIREAIELFCKSRDRLQIIHDTCGAWKDNDFDFVALRKTWDRKFE